MAIPESNGKTVLITGINGYIASVLGMHLLSKGYSLRGTSRKAASAEPLLKGPYAPYANRVKMYEVPDMTVEGAFDEAVKGPKNSLLLPKSRVYISQEWMVSSTQLLLSIFQPM
jgi:nucleoside-diphosphate-sugar epimerase